MAFVVQGDAPVAGANAYVAVSFFREYHADRGVDTSTYADRDIEFSIVKASQYLDLRFEYVGDRALSTQALEWPRQFAYDDRGNSVAGLPLAVKQAASEYALRALSADLLADPSRDGSGYDVKSKAEVVGPIQEKVEYDLTRGYSMPEYPIADRMLTSRGLVSSGSTGVRNGLSSFPLGRG